MREGQTAKILIENQAIRGDLYFRALGCLPLIFFVAQGIHYWRINELGHMLWMCNIGNLLLALGLFINRPVMIRVSAIWMIPGLLTWLLFVVFTWGVVLASVLAHIGGLLVGLVALRRVGINRLDWISALCWYFLVQLVSRLTTPVDFNVNVSQSIYAGWEQRFDAYWKFWLVMSLLVGVVLWTITLGLNRLWPADLKEGSLV